MGNASLSASGLADDLLEEGEELTASERRVVRFCVTVLGLLSALTLLGVASSLYLVNHYPLLLISISPIGRHLLLVAPIVDPVAFVAVAVARTALSCFTFFFLGRALGPRGLVWLDSRAARTARFVRWLQRIFDRWSVPAVLFAGGPGMSSIAGVSGMRLGLFAPLVLIGLVGRMMGMLLFADWLREPILWLLVVIEEYQIPGTIVLVVLLIAWQWRKRRSHGTLIR